MLKKFIDAAEAELQNPSRSAFFAVQEEFTNLIFDSPFVTDTLNGMLSKVARESAFEPPILDADTVTLAQGEHWRLTYGAPRTGASFLYSYPGHALVAVVGREPLVVRHYAATGNIDTDVFDPDIGLTLRKNDEHRSGDFFTVDACMDVDEVVEPSAARIVVLTGAPRGAIRWAFCRKTLRAVQPIASVPVDASIVTYVRALAAMNAMDSVPTLNALTAHPSHFVRWTALQALLQLDPNAAVSELRRAANDPHPHIKQASEKVIARLGA